jgi:hypothetical protein
MLLIIIEIPVVKVNMRFFFPLSIHWVFSSTDKNSSPSYNWKIVEFGENDKQVNNP